MGVAFRERNFSAYRRFSLAAWQMTRCRRVILEAAKEKPIKMRRDLLTRSAHVALLPFSRQLYSLSLSLF